MNIPISRIMSVDSEFRRRMKKKYDTLELSRHIKIMARCAGPDDPLWDEVFYPVGSSKRDPEYFMEAITPPAAPAPSSQKVEK